MYVNNLNENKFTTASFYNPTKDSLKSQENSMGKYCVELFFLLHERKSVRNLQHVIDLESKVFKLSWHAFL